MKIGWALDMIGWACAQPFPTLATPLNGIVLKSHHTEYTGHSRGYIYCVVGMFGMGKFGGFTLIKNLMKEK